MTARLCFFLVFPVFAAAKDIVFLVEHSPYTKNSLGALRAGAASYFRDISISGVDPYGFHLHAWERTGPLQMILNGSRDANVVVGAIGALQDIPLSACPSGCCYGKTSFATHFDYILEQHQGNIIINLLTCPYAQDDQQRRDWATKIRKTSTNVYIFRPRDNYCLSAGSTHDELRDFAEETWLLNSTHFDDIFALATLHHHSNSPLLSYDGVCQSAGGASDIEGNPQAIAYVFALGELTQMPVVQTPTGEQWSGNVQALFDDRDGPRAVILHSDCPTGWRYFDGQCYLIERQRLPYEAAVENCKSKNSALVMQFNDKLRDFLNTGANVEGEEDDKDGLLYWIGLNDLNLAKEFRWIMNNKYVSLKNANFSSWAPNEPRASPLGSRCTALSRQLSDRWIVKFCNSLLPSICSRPKYEYGASPETQTLPNGYWSAKYDSFSTCKMRTYVLY